MLRRPDAQRDASFNQDLLLKVKDVPTWIGPEMLDVEFYKSEDLLQKVFAAYPGARICFNDQARLSHIISLRFFADDAHHFAERFAQHNPTRVIVPWEEMQKNSPLAQATRGDLYILASSRISDPYSAQPRITPDGSEQISLKVRDTQLVSEALDRLVRKFSTDEFKIIGHKSATLATLADIGVASVMTPEIRAVQKSGAEGYHTVLLMGDAAKLYALQHNSFMSQEGSAPGSSSRRGRA